MNPCCVKLTTSFFEQMSMDVKNFSFCPHCGERIKKESNTNPWLIRGWLYEGKKMNSYCAGYFAKIKNGEAQFVEYKDDIENEVKYWTFSGEYKIANVPLDYAPDWATHIKIDEDGNWKFWIDAVQTEFYEEDWLPWSDCPEQLKGKILSIPKLVKEKRCRKN